MPTRIVLLVRRLQGMFLIGCADSSAGLALSGIEDAKTPFGMDEEATPS
jgi:hypothetical protein